ncbi:MAG: MFS transporter [Pyrinomonadaceae bacterium]|nr:MFS transporter [Pyrinomonadaceae bacterium]
MSKSNLSEWNVEDVEFWNSKGKSIANRNLWISIPSLLVGFAVWLMWGIITVQMKNLGFPFEQNELFTLTAIAGLTGATLRIPSSFFIRLAGGRNTIFFTTALLMIPALGAAIALQNKDTPLWIFQILALLSGLGGGNFASSMSNISFFYPKKKQGFALGMNAGLGNFGVTTMQILIPLAMTIPIVGALSGEPMILTSNSGTIFKRIAAGSETFLSNAGWVWMFFLIPLAFLGWFRMNNITTEAVTPALKGTLVSFARIGWLLVIALAAATLGLVVILSFPGVTWVKWLTLPLVVAVTVVALKALSPGEIRDNLQRQYRIFGDKHTWVMTIIYTMTFGSFIGFAAAVGLSIKFIFGVQHLMVDGVLTHDTPNPAGPATFMYVWVGAFIGALIRPVGGWISDKTGGAIVTQIVSIVMIVCSVGVGYFAKLAYASPTPQDYFLPFFILLVILFTATGIGNGSTFRTIGVIFEEEKRGPVLGWTSAVAAYGAFIIPQVIGEQMAAKTPEYAMYGFAVFYAVCAVLNWWFYLGPKADYKNP